MNRACQWGKSKERERAQERIRRRGNGNDSEINVLYLPYAQLPGVISVSLTAAKAPASYTFLQLAQTVVYEHRLSPVGIFNYSALYGGRGDSSVRLNARHT